VSHSLFGMGWAGSLWLGRAPVRRALRRALVLADIADRSLTSRGRAVARGGPPRPRGPSGHDVQVIDLDAAGYPLLSVIVDQGMLVHQGVRSAYARWRSHALSQLDLDRAWYARMRDGYLAKLAEGARR